MHTKPHFLQLFNKFEQELHFSIWYGASTSLFTRGSANVPFDSSCQLPQNWYVVVLVPTCDGVSFAVLTLWSFHVFRHFTSGSTPAIMEDITQFIRETVANFTKGLNVTTEATPRPPATPEGMAVAYGSLVLMAVFPVFYGALRSVNFHKSEKKKEKVWMPLFPQIPALGTNVGFQLQDSGVEAEKLSYSDAAMFPFLASGALLVLYFVFKVSLVFCTFLLNL